MPELTDLKLNIPINKKKKKMPSINRLMGHHVQKLVTSRNGLKTTESFTDSLTEKVSVHDNSKNNILR